MKTENAPEYWDSLGVTYWHIGGPLRPSTEDTKIMESAVRRWAPRVESGRMRALLLGVTPAIAEMEWPPNTFLTATERSIGMAKSLWPGDVPGKRKVVVSNWMALPFKDESCHVVAGDGALSCVRYPEESRRLLVNVARVLKRGGVLVLRCFLRPEKPDCPGDLIRTIFDQHEVNFTQFRTRLTMAMQRDPKSGVVVGDVYRLWSAQNFDLDELIARTGWKRPEIEIIERHHDNSMVYTFLTLDELRLEFGEWFEEIEILTPSYSWGSRFSTLVLRRR